MNKKKIGYWYWWWDNNDWWVCMGGITVLCLALFYGIIRTATYLVEVLPDWVIAAILFSALFVCVFLLVLGSYWNYREDIKEPKKL